MRVALVQSESRSDRRALCIARALRDHGHRATLIVPQGQAGPATPAFAAAWLAEGFGCLPVCSAIPELAAAFDCAWFLEPDWVAAVLRERRFQDRSLPLVVLDAASDAVPAPALQGEIDLVCDGSENEARTVRRVEELYLRRSSEPLSEIRGVPPFEPHPDPRTAIDTAQPSSPPAKRRLRLLLLSSSFPFGVNSGRHRRLREMIRYFSSRHELTLLTPAPAEWHWGMRREALRHLHALREAGWTDEFTAGSELLPAGVRARCRAAIQSALRAMPTHRYQAALIDMIFMAEFRNDIMTVPVLTEHNIESQLLRQASAYSRMELLTEAFRAPAQEAAQLAAYENRTWPDFPLRAVVSEVDRAHMDNRVTSGQTVLAPNGADLSRWLESARPDTDTALFAGHLGYFPNMDGVDFLLSEVWPRVRKRKSNARLLIAGRSPGEAIRASIAKAPGVRLIANPVSMDGIARRASVAVAPLRFGSGTRLKILDSMAWGLPVASTMQGAEGIDAVDGEQILIRDDAEEFAEAIVRLMSDAELWLRLRNGGRELVRARYSWDRVFEPLEAALIELLS